MPISPAVSRFLSRLASALVVAVLLVLLTVRGAQPSRVAQASPPLADPVTVIVSSNVKWANTGIQVNVGDQLSITAAGSWFPGGPETASVGPDGSSILWPDNFLNLTDIGVCAFCATTKTPHWAALVGYIGEAPPSIVSYTSTSVLPEAQKVFLVGSSFSAKATLAGTLWLNFNDDAYSGFTVDNTGQVTAQVKATATVPIKILLDFLGSQKFAKFMQLMKLTVDVTACIIDSAYVIGPVISGLPPNSPPPDMVQHCGPAFQPIIDLLLK